MTQKLFETKDGDSLYVNIENKTFRTNNINAVKTALMEDLEDENFFIRELAKSLLFVLKNFTRESSFNDLLQDLTEKKCVLVSFQDVSEFVEFAAQHDVVVCGGAFDGAGQWLYIW